MDHLQVNTRPFLHLQRRFRCQRHLPVAVRSHRSQCTSPSHFRTFNSREREQDDAEPQTPQKKPLASFRSQEAVGEPPTALEVAGGGKEEGRSVSTARTASARREQSDASQSSIRNDRALASVTNSDTCSTARSFSTSTSDSSRGTQR